MFDEYIRQGKNGTPDFLKDLLGQIAEDSVIRAQLNDQRLLKLAEYDVTQGLVKFKVAPEEFQTKFNEFKGLVQRGSFSLKDLEDDVYNRWGIQEVPRQDSTGIEPSSIGFNANFDVDNLDVADIPEDSPDNH